MSIKFDTYRVTIDINDRLIGGVPVVSDESAELRQAVYRGWAKGQGVEATDIASLAEDLSNDPDMPIATVEEPELGNGFKRDENAAPYIEARQIKALIREAAQRLGIIKARRGARQVVQHDIHVRALDGSQRIRFVNDDGETLENVSGADSRPISVMTPQGPRTSIKRYEYIEAPARIVFDVRLLRGGVGDAIVKGDDLEDIFTLGQDLGLGADRSQGEGTYTLQEVVPLDA